MSAAGGSDIALIFAWTLGAGAALVTWPLRQSQTPRQSQSHINISILVQQFHFLLL